MAFAIVKIGNIQVLAEEGDVFKMIKQDEPLKTEVLLYSDGQSTKIGEPVLKDVKAKVSIVEEGFEKTRIGRFKAKSRYRRIKGHKQPIMMVKVEKIGKAEKEVKEESVVVAKAKPAKKKAPVKKAAAKKEAK